MRTGIILLALGFLVCTIAIVLAEEWNPRAGFLHNLQTRAITVSDGELAEPEAIGACHPIQHAETGEYLFYARGENLEVCDWLGIPESRRVNQTRLPIKYPFIGGIVLMVAGAVVAFLGRARSQ